jgi:nitrite reductase/ring-hydroxylating ferredoxin subunit
MAAEHVDCGPPGQLVNGQAVFVDGPNFFVIRDAGGIYAVASRCTHQGAPLQQAGDRFHCNRHNSNFTLNGEVINGPAAMPLKHYETCLLPNGHVGVRTATVVDPAARLEV